MPVTNKTKAQGASFRDWFSEVNSILSDILGLSALDMEDYLWRDDFEDDLTPKEGIEGAFDYWEEDFSFATIADDMRERLSAYEPEPEEYHWLREDRPICGADPGEHWGSVKWTRDYFLNPKIGDSYYLSCSNCQSMIRGEGG